MTKKPLIKHFLSLFYLFVGTFSSAILAMIVSIFLARHMTLQAYGNYSAMLAIITTLMPLCGFGIAQYWLKIFGEHASYAILWIKKSLEFITLTTLFIFIILVIFFCISLKTNHLIFAGILLSFIVFKNVSSEIITSVFQIENRYLAISIWQFLQNSLVLFLLLTVVFVFKIDLNELTISIIQLIITIIIFSSALYFFTSFIKKQKRKINLKKLLKLKNEQSLKLITIFKEAAPFGFAGLFYSIYYQFGIVFVRYFISSEASAKYSVAFTFLTAALLVPSIIYQKFLLPKLHRWAYHDKEKFIKSFNYGNLLMLTLGILGFLFMWFLSPFFIKLFFGSKYEASIELIKLMSINIPIVYLASSAGSLLVTKNYMKIKVYYMGISALISLSLNYPLIKIFGINGAIYTNIICNSFILIIYFYKVNKDILKRKENHEL